MKFTPHGVVSEKFRNLCTEHDGDGPQIYAALKEDWGYLMADAHRAGQVRGENTIAGNLTTNFLILAATTQASPKFASVKMFARAENPDPYKPLAVGEMKFNVTAQDGSSTLTNATNFESGDSVLNAVAIAVAQYTEPFHLTNTHLNSGIRMEDLVTAKLNSLGSKISKVLATNITVANYATITPVISAVGGFGYSDLGTARGEIKKANRKHVMLDGELLSRITNTPSFFQAVPVVPGAAWKNVSGWDYIAEHHEWSAAGNNIRGFFCDPQAMAVIAGLPLIGPTNGILGTAAGTMPGVDLDILACTWLNTSTRTYWGSFDIMFGAAPLDTTIGGVIATGQPT